MSGADGRPGRAGRGRGSASAGVPVSASSARRTLLLLTFTRWFPVGLVIGITVLLALERGMSLAQLGVILAMQGFVVLALELPTGGLADAVGRRPVLVAAGVVGVAAVLVFVTARTFGAFVLALLLQGVFRALDSGPLEAWFVDAAQADEPDVDVEGSLAAAGTVLGLSIASGALVSGGLVAWDPVAATTALELPYWVALVLSAVHVVLVAVRVHETRGHLDATGARGAAGAVRQAPRVVVDGLRMLARSPVLRALVLVEVFWSVGMIAFESLMPVRLSELVGGETRAGVLMGPVSAVAWGLFAVGSAAAGRAARRLGTAWTAVAARVLNGAMIVVMGLVGGAVGLVTAFLLTYTLHGAGGPVHNALLHRQASAHNRTTVLSMNSMVAGAAYSVGLLALGPLAEHTSTALAIVVAGGFSILGAALYLPAVRQERRPGTAPVVVDAGPAAGAGDRPGTDQP